MKSARQISKMLRTKCSLRWLSIVVQKPRRLSRSCAPEKKGKPIVERKPNEIEPSVVSLALLRSGAVIRPTQARIKRRRLRGFEARGLGISNSFFQARA